MTAVGYVCLLEGQLSGAKFLHLFNSCYHMVGSSSEILLSKYDDIIMETIKDNNGEYFFAVQGIDRTKTDNFQEICSYPEREYILYYWYWSMTHTCVLENTEEKYIFPDFENTIFKAGESKIDSKASQMFRIVYGIFY